MTLALAETNIQTVRTVKDLRDQVKAWRIQGLTIGLVPTMGSLHEGHLSLVKKALEKTDRVIGTVFVNPKQFAPHEDFDTYPREEDSDREKLETAGAHLLYAPLPQEMYPDNFQTSVNVEGLGQGLCSDQRPHFFGGVATVVTKLLIQAMPDVAVFGEKDYQQLCIIKKLAADLDLPIEIIGGAIVRDAEGLALSSRNQYLDDAQLQTARQLNKVLFATAAALRSGTPVTQALENGKQQILDAGFNQLDYLELRTAETLEPQEAYTAPGRLFVAARLGETRLIDNISVES